MAAMMVAQKVAKRVEMLVGYLERMKAAQRVESRVVQRVDW